MCTTRRDGARGETYWVTVTAVTSCPGLTSLLLCVQAWSQPHEEPTTLGHPLEGDEEEFPTVLTKPKILCVAITLREYELSGRIRYVLSAADYQRLVDAVGA